jgi:hypothetical protein
MRTMPWKLVFVSKVSVFFTLWDFSIPRVSIVLSDWNVLTWTFVASNWFGMHVSGRWLHWNWNSPILATTWNRRASFCVLFYFGFYSGILKDGALMYKNGNSDYSSELWVSLSEVKRLKFKRRTSRCDQKCLRGMREGVASLVIWL